MLIADLMLSLILTCWWILCLAAQWKISFINKLRPKDVFRFIPNWRLFAPVPQLRDYHLEYRTQTETQQCLPWKRIELIPRRNTSSILWYPQKRLRRELVTSVGRITASFSKGGQKAAMRSVSYLNFLNYIQRLQDTTSAHAVQFRIVSTQDHVKESKLYTIFTSNWHVQKK